MTQRGLYDEHGKPLRLRSQEEAAMDLARKVRKRLANLGQTKCQSGSRPIIGRKLKQRGWQVHLVSPPLGIPESSQEAQPDERLT